MLTQTTTKTSIEVKILKAVAVAAIGLSAFAAVAGFILQGQELNTSNKEISRQLATAGLTGTNSQPQQSKTNPFLANAGLALDVEEPSEVIVLSGAKAGVYLIEGVKPGVYQTFEDIPFPKAELISDKKQVSSQFNGYIIQFKEKPLAVQWQELENKVKSKAISPIRAKTQFNVQASTFNSLFQSRKTKLATLTPDFNKKIKKEFRSVFNGLSLDITKEQAEKIKKLDFVQRVYPNYRVQVLLMDSVPLINADDVWDLGYKGEGTTIAIIDTGIDYTHSDLGGCLGETCKVIGGYDFVNNDSDPMDDHGHGTHCAGIASSNGELKGVAPEANLYGYKVLDQRGSGYWDWVIAGIERAINPNQDEDYSDRADVISMSLGCYDGGKECNQDDPVSQAVDNAVKVGTVAVIAAGNSGPSIRTIGSPGTARKALTVGASCKPSQIGVHQYCPTEIASFSSRGPTAVGVKPDIVAPGVDICASQWDNAWNDRKCFDDKHIAVSGTSMATPHLAGAAALIKQAHPDWSAEEIKMALRNTALDLGYDMSSQGYGRVDVLKAVQSQKPAVAALYNPVKIQGESFNVQGTAIGDNFVLSYAQGENPQPSAWTEICRGTANVIDNVLCLWNIRDLNDGKYTLRLVAKAEIQESVEFGFIEIEHVKINYPDDLEGHYYSEVDSVLFPTWKEIEIKGVATGDNFKNYILEWCDKQHNCNTEGITLTNQGNLPVVNNILGVWNPALINQANYYYLKLTVFYNSPLDASRVDEVKVYIDPTLHQGWPKNVTGPHGYFTPAFMYQPTLVDIDNNGAQEIIIAYNQDIQVFKGDGSYLLGWPKSIKSDCLMQKGPAVTNLDGDRYGYQEIVVGDNCDNLHVLDYQGNYLPGWPKKFKAGGISIDDINQDGNLEIVFSNGASLYVIDVNGNNLEGFPKDLIFNIESPVNIAGRHKAIVVTAKESGTENRKIYLIDHQGNILPGWPKEFNGEIRIALGDVVEDNNLVEIVVGTLNGIYIYSLEGTVLETVLEASNLQRIGGLTLGDIDKDGKIEIAALLKEEENPFDFLHLFNKSKAEWEEEPGFPIKQDLPKSEWHPLLGNLDTDSENEISAGSRSGGTNKGYLLNFSVYNIDGSIASGFPKVLDESMLSDGFPIGDIDGDGKNELITHTWKGDIFVWDIESLAGKNEWPMFYHNPQHTNLYTPPGYIPPEPLLGDINQDGKINAQDWILMEKFLKHAQEPTPEQKELSDLNANQKIDRHDWVALQKLIEGKIGQKDLPLLLGDVNNSKTLTGGDAAMVKQMLAGMGEWNEVQKLRADANANKRIDEHDVQLISNVVVGIIAQQDLPIEMGDFDDNDQIKSDDIIKTMKYLDPKNKPTAKELLCGDMNLNGKFDQQDLATIKTMWGKYTIESECLVPPVD